jgi:DNA replication protein DnaC
MSDSLRRLGLTTLAAALPQVLATARQQQPAYEQFLHGALETELQGRAERAHARRLRAAHLPLVKSLDSFDFAFQPSVSPVVIRELATLEFVRSATNVLLLGPPGVGKTHLAIGLAKAAVDGGYGVRFTTLRELAQDLGTLSPRHRQQRYVSPHVLVIDEVGYLRLTLDQSQGLFDVVAARYERGAIILTSNRSFSEWGTVLGDEVLATALLDRLLHHAEVISIAGRSYRLKDRLPKPEGDSREVGQFDTIAPGSNRHER